MALFMLVALVAASVIMSLMSWRRGIFCMALIAAVQDPLRKLVPGTPGWLALATVPVFFALIAASLAATPSWWALFRARFNRIASALTILAFLSLPAAAISLTYGAGSWMLTILGAISYSVIFLGVIAGFHFPRRHEDVRRLLVWYCLIHGVMLTGALFEFMGWFSGWKVIGDEALGYNWFRSVPGYTVDILCGFYRSGDVMGWHAATVSILAFTLALSSSRRRILWLLISAVAIAALLLCGRRKMVYMLPVFAMALAWVYWRAGRSSQTWSLVGILTIPAASVWLIGDVIREDVGQIRYYTETSYETLDRFQVHGFDSLFNTYQQSGFFGDGLGVATPGSHHLNVERPRTWQESGPSRILVELGVPGALGFLAVMLAIMLALWRTVIQQIRARTYFSPYGAGLVGFFLANVGSLIVSGQILADPFIAAFLGFLVGLVLSFARFKSPAMSDTVVSQPHVGLA